MRGKSYTFFIASTPGKLRKVIVPAYILHGIAVLAIIGAISVTAAVGSYSRMLWKVGNYNALVQQQDHLQQQYQQLQNTVKDTDQRLSSLQSLATEVAMTYGFMHLRTSPFGLGAARLAPEAPLDRTLDEFNFLAKNATSVALANNSLRLVPTLTLGEMTFSPTLWPVIGRIT